MRRQQQQLHLQVAPVLSTAAVRSQQSFTTLSKQSLMHTKYTNSTKMNGDQEASEDVILGTRCNEPDTASSSSLRAFPEKF